MIRTYRALLVAQIQAASAYRVQSILWMLFSVIRPVIFLAAWVAVANSQGGQIGPYDVRDFAAYYICLSLVSNLTMSWNAYDFEFEVRLGRLSPKLLRPLHPIHYSVVENIVWKLTTIVPLGIILVFISLTFDARFRTTPAHLLLFVPSVLLAAALAFFSGWVLATLAFWTTRVHAVSTFWDRAAFIFAGQIAPLALLPGPLQAISLALPFGYILGVPAEILRGGVSVPTALQLMAGQAIWLVVFYFAFHRVWRVGGPAVQRGGRLMVRYLRLLRLFFRTELQYELEYRLNLLLEIVQTIVVTATSVGAILVLFSYTTVLNGWDLGAMLVLLGCFYLVQGFGELVLQPSFEKFMEHVRLGTLDFALLKPVSAQFLVTLRNFQVVQLAQMGLGAIVVGVGLSRIPSIGVAEAIGFPIALVCGFGLIYALLLALSTFAFWFVRVDNLMALYWSFMDAGRFPVDVYPGWLRITLSSAVPIGVAVTVPAQVIAGRLDPLGLGLLIVGTVAAFVLVVVLATRPAVVHRGERVSDPKPSAEGMDIGGFLREPTAGAESSGTSEPESRGGAGIPARVSFVTLAVRDFARMARFYRQFGWPESKDSNDDFVAFQTGGAILGLFPAKYYAALGDAPAAGAFKGFELAMNLDDTAHVDSVYAALRSFADLRLQGPPKDLSIGGRAFSFLDPEDNAWEVIWKSGTSFDERGGLIFP